MKLNKCENNYRCDEDDVTMDELIKAYVKDKFILTGGMSVTDQKATSYRFKRHILPFFKGLKVVQISKVHFHFASLRFRS